MHNMQVYFSLQVKSIVGGMGNLLKVLTRQSEPGNTDIFIDFESKPS